MKETFSAALRAEIEAIVMRYEALVSSRVEAAERDGATSARDDLAKLRGERDELSRELATLRVQRERLSLELDTARERIASLEAEVRAGAAVASALEEQFSAEKRFVAACAEVSGTMLEGALRGAVGREIEASPALYAALKAKGLELVLVAAFKERGRTIAHAPLLERERAPLSALAGAAGGGLGAPPPGPRV
jgi:hypothetical protein